MENGYYTRFIDVSPPPKDGGFIWIDKQNGHIKYTPVDLPNWIIQRLARFAFGCELNPIKVQAHFSRGMVASFLSNALLESGRSSLGKDLVQLARMRVASRNGCPF